MAARSRRSKAVIRSCTKGRKRRQVAGEAAQAALWRPGIQQEMQGRAEIFVAGPQSRARLGVAGCDVIQHDDVGGSLLIAGRGFPGDRLFDQLQARLNMRDQGTEIRDDRAVSIILILGWDRDAVACCILRRCTPYPCFRGALLLVR